MNPELFHGKLNSHLHLIHAFEYIDSITIYFNLFSFLIIFQILIVPCRPKCGPRFPIYSIILFLDIRHVNPVRRIFALFKLFHDKLNPTYLFPSLSRSLLIDTPKISIKKNSPAQYPLDPQLLHKSVIQLASSSSSSPSLNHDQEENRENWDGSIQRDVSIKPDPDR